MICLKASKLFFQSELCSPSFTASIIITTLQEDCAPYNSIVVDQSHWNVGAARCK